MNPCPSSRRGGLYVHVPFCAKKCAYCAFYSAAENAVERWGEAWLEGIRREAAQAPDSFRPATIYIGGGTPTVLPDSLLARLLDELADRWGGSDLQEWTVEANPGTLTPGNLHRMKMAGVTRLSLGAQSFSDAALTWLGRIHRAGQTQRAVAMAREAGFVHLSLDLMYGWPSPDALETLRADLDAAMQLEPEHLSAYCLEIEPGTPLAERQARGESVTTTEEQQREAYDLLRTRLAAAGWPAYEISNFARPGCECRHNELYWSGGEYFGWGPAAHSHWDGERFANSATLPHWSCTFRERLSPQRKACETLVMGLRRINGWTRDHFRAVTGFDYDDLRGAEIEQMAVAGLLWMTPQSIRLSPDALFISDTVFAALV